MMPRRIRLLAARGESLAAFDERCIPKPPQRGCRAGGPGASGVAPPSNTPGILSRRALPAGRLARLGATPDSHHGLLGVSLAILVAVFAVTNGRLSGQTGAPAREWRTWGGELANTKYSPLDQINKDNFNKLEVAWRFKTDALGPRPEFNYETTPLMANGG